MSTFLRKRGVFLSFIVLTLSACSANPRADDEGVVYISVSEEIDVPTDDLYMTLYMMEASEGGRLQEGNAIFFCSGLAEQFEQWLTNGGTVPGFELSWGPQRDQDSPEMMFVVDGIEVVMTVGLETQPSGRECISWVEFDPESAKERIAPWMP